MGGFEGLGDKGSLRRWLQRDTAACGTRGEVAPGHMGTVQGAMLVLSAGGPRASFDSTPQLVMADGPCVTVRRPPALPAIATVKTLHCSLKTS